MMRPKEMTMVRILSHERNIQDVVETLYDLKVLHIIDFKKTDELDIGRPLKEANIYSQQLIDLRSAISRLGIDAQPRDLKNVKDAQKKFSSLNKQFKEIVTRLDALKAGESRLAENANNTLAGLGITKNRVKEYKSLVIFAGTVKTPIEQKIGALTKNYMLIQEKTEKHIAFALFISRSLAEKAKEILGEAGFSEVALPELSKADAEGRLAKTRKEIAASQRALDSFKKSNAQFLVDYEFVLMQLNEKAEAPLRFGASKSAFIATGWVPVDKAEELKQALGNATKEKISIELLPSNDPPTVLKNPKPVKSFEFLLNLYSLPRHYEIDPTVLMFFTFPLFFGFMLGDVGYGIITLALMLVLERRMGAKPLIRIITIASLASIAFGFVFGEAFGYEFIGHPLLSRVHDINTMMLISVAIGVIHINAGFVLGFINELKHHSFVNSFFRKGAWITLQAGVALLAAGFLQHSQLPEATGAAVAIASILMIIKGEGILRVIELPTLLSNTLSYLRLYAIGLSSVSLAAVFNKMSAGLFAQGGIALIFGVAVLLLGHVVNLLLGMLGPFLHSVRLHYVEFFQKFYEGGGYMYDPFGFVKSRR